MMFDKFTLTIAFIVLILVLLTVLYHLTVMVFGEFTIPDNKTLFNDTLRKEWLDDQVKELEKCIESGQCFDALKKVYKKHKV